MVPFKRLAEIENGKNGKDRERDDFLYRFELYARKLAGTNAVSRHLQAIFEKREAPADQDHLPKGLFLELQMAIPSECHEDIR